MKPVTLHELVAFNREICALASASVPLDEGLIRVAQEFSGPTGALAQRIADRTAAGATLSQAIDEEKDHLPESYRVLVRAGILSGKLTAALEGYGQTAERLANLRQMTLLAAIYPLGIACAAWILLLFFGTTLISNLEWIGINDRFWISYLHLPKEWNWWLVPLVPAVLLLLFIAWLRLSRNAKATVSTDRFSWLSWMPGAARIRKLGCQASFADLLALFVAHHVPLDEALPLAGDASGMPSLKHASFQLGNQIANGNKLSTDPAAFRQLPALVRLALIDDRGPVALANNLRQAATIYQRRAQITANRAGYYFPLIFTAVMGGTVVCLYAFLLLQPYAASLKEIARWS
jgi:type II secretory pathway component PulF